MDSSSTSIPIAIKYGNKTYHLSLDNQSNLSKNEQFNLSCEHQTEQILFLKKMIINFKHADNIIKNLIMIYLNIFSLIILERMFYGSLPHTSI